VTFVCGAGGSVAGGGCGADGVSDATGAAVIAGGVTVFEMLQANNRVDRITRAYTNRRMGSPNIYLLYVLFVNS
jgi:hypothetical protein